MAADSLILFPPFRLDVLNEQLWRAETLVPVRPKPFAVLAYLATHPDRLVTAAELWEAVWPDTYVSEGLLCSYIREVRHLLGDDVEQGSGEEGIEQMHQGLIAYRATRAELVWPYWRALLAEVYGKRGQTQEELATVTKHWRRLRKLANGSAKQYVIRGLQLVHGRFRHGGSARGKGAA